MTQDIGRREFVGQVGGLAIGLGRAQNRIATGRRPPRHGMGPALGEEATAD